MQGTAPPDTTGKSHNDYSLNRLTPARAVLHVVGEGIAFAGLIAVIGILLWGAA